MPTFTLEDGTGLSTATSYTSEAFADDYLADAAWAADSAAKQAALMAATEYFDARWGPILRGLPLVTDQALEFPRSRLYDRYGRLVEGVPNDVQKAVSLYAKEHVAGTLYPTPPSGNAQELKRKKTVVGPIQTEVEYHGLNTSASWLAFPLADKLVRQYARSSSGGTMRN